MTFIIGEVGSNWRTFEDAKDSIALAKSCGADAVKFQAFTGEALYGGEGSMVNELPLEWLPKLKEKADACKIEFMCTAFSPELVAAVDPFISRHKVASSDLTWPQLLDAVVKTGKPIILSTGASSRGDIEQALNHLGPARERTTLLYCVAAYPARMIDLRKIDLMREAFGLPVGFSDHSIDIYGLPVEACEAHGAVVLEKHFTARPELQSPDRGHSLTADEFKLMVDHIRGKREPVIAPSQEERDMILRHNRRLIVTQDVADGEQLVYGRNYGAYRALKDDDKGLSPFFWNHPKGPEGKRTTKALGRGESIGPGDFG